MIKYLWIYSCIILFGYTSCGGQDKNDGKIDNTEEYTDVTSPSPFEFKRDNMLVLLPDSLGGSNVTGFAVLEVSISNEAHIEDYNIMKLVVNRANKTPIIDYYYGKGNIYDEVFYPNEVKKYYPFFGDYLKSLHLSKNPGIKAEKINKTTIMVRFN